MYRVGKRKLEVHRDGKDITLFPGDEIPEAADFPNLRMYLRNNLVTCDYQNDEPPVDTLPPVLRSWTEVHAEKQAVQESAQENDAATNTEQESAPSNSKGKGTRQKRSSV